MDKSWPDRTPVLLNQAVQLGSGLAKEEQVGTFIYGALEPRYAHSWRWLFSSRLRAASTFAIAESWCQAATRAEGLPWPEHKKAHENISAEIARWPEPIVRVIVEDAFKWPKRSRDVRCRLRLLRLAAHFAVTGEVLPLDDPFGGKLGCSAKGARLKVWSVGPDGVDDDGSGDWNSGKDIVLEVSR